MKIVICDGKNAADYIIKMFSGNKNKLIVINSDREYGANLSKTHRIPVIIGDPSKKQILDIAHIEGADILIALNDRDTDSFVTCRLAKKLYNVKKTICTVHDPNNVDLFKSLGVDSVISSTYLLASSVKTESSLESLIKTMSLENDKIAMLEVTVSENFAIANRKIMEINFPRYANISCIYRQPHVVIPNGQTMILPKDILLIICSPADQEKVIEFVQKTHR